MNWYKISQIIDPLDDPNNYTGSLRDDIFELVKDEISLTKVCNQYKTSFNKVQFDNNQIIYVVKYGKPMQWLILTELDNPLSSTAENWLADINPEHYINIPNTFWNEVGVGSRVYHGTPEENIPNIMKEGLLPMNKTRGISNRSTGSGIFTSYSPEYAREYYGKVIEINIENMKRDGYMPEVEQETPISEAESKRSIAWKLGIKDYVPDVEDGISNDTVVFYQVIPPKYLKVL